MFWELHRHRPAGWGPTPLPYRDVVAWLDANDVTEPNLRSDLLTLVGAMDTTWLEWAIEQQKQRNETARRESERRRVNRG
jgi:hypothetical protein